MFYCCRTILIWHKISEVFWKIYLNIVFRILLWMLTSLRIWNLNITVSTTMKYYKWALNKKLKLMRGTMKYFPKKLLGHEILGLWSPGLQIFFWKIYKTLRPPPSTYLLYTPLYKLTDVLEGSYSTWCLMPLLGKLLKFTCKWKSKNILPCDILRNLIKELKIRCKYLIN